jgi:A/G-specific adenine glycosylase
MADLSRVHAALLDWYAAHGRDLPWRHTREPYAILVAEVMLQQTQVERVIPKWHAWLARFPTLEALAKATRGDAIRAWEGLGYNLRAVRLHAIARQCAADCGGTLPSSVEGLRTLKGIGRYTAGAVACFAYGQPVAIVDTNVRRVLSRVFELETRAVDGMAQRFVPVGPNEAAYKWNQALMDLGATLCRSREPLCLVCPLLGECGGPRPRPVAAGARSNGSFHGSTRFFRGRVIGRLRQLGGAETVALDDLLAEVGASRDLVFNLASEGLLEIYDDRVRLVD